MINATETLGGELLPSARRDTTSRAAESYPETQMRVKKRNGPSSPSTSTRSCAPWALRCRARSRRSDARRAQDDRRSLRRGYHQRARSTLDPDRGRAHRRRAGVLEARRAPARRPSSTRRSMAGIHSFSQSMAAGHRVGLVNDACGVRRGKCTQAQRCASTPSAIRALRILRPSHGLRPLPAEGIPSTREVIETPQHFFLRVACGLADDGGRSGRVLR